MKEIKVNVQVIESNLLGNLYGQDKMITSKITKERETHGYWKEKRICLVLRY